MITGAYERRLVKNPAIQVPLTLLGFLDRAALVRPERVAIIHGELQRTWAKTRERCYRLASALVGKASHFFCSSPTSPGAWVPPTSLPSTSPGQCGNGLLITTLLITIRDKQ